MGWLFQRFMLVGCFVGGCDAGVGWVVIVVGLLVCELLCLGVT